jgi:predicted HicB family RNase H-like nuclease
MIYKGDTGAVEVDEDSGTLFGTVLGTRDLITFVGKTVEEARQSLADSVECYLEHCASISKEPDQPFTGWFEVRVKSEVHRELEELAHTWKVDLNDVVAEALDRFIAANRPAEYRPPVHPPAQKRRKPTPAVRPADEPAAEAPKRRRASKAV